MTLNPVQFGSQVVDQFGRYLLTNFPIADKDLNDQFKKLVVHKPRGEGYFAKGPYVHLNQPFEEGKNINLLIEELNLHKGIKAGFPWEKLHKHQEEAIRTIKHDIHTIITTGTGSGKTEAFLLPIMDYCLKKRDESVNEGVLAVIVYPMNALVNDQMKRLRTILAGTGITYARYTGETPKKDPGYKRFRQPQNYTQNDKEKIINDPDSVSYPWELCQSKEEIRQRKPMILLTNYKQLEYLLLRNEDIDLFKNKNIKYMVFDEIHTYTGILGSEVAFLIRRLKAITENKENIICIGTSATVSSQKYYGIDSKEETRKFGHRIFGVDKNKIRIIGEYFKIKGQTPTDAYMPPAPTNSENLLKEILEISRTLLLKDEVTDIPDELLQKAELLCGRKAPNANTNIERLSELLIKNKMIYLLNREFSNPKILNKSFDILRKKVKRKGSDDELGAEILIYLTLGAIAKYEDEPMLRPKLHYFVSGLHGLIASYQNGKWRLYKDEVDAEKAHDSINLPVYLCRTCGQHYFKVYIDNYWNTSPDDNKADFKIIQPAHESYNPDQPSLYLTDQLTSGEDEARKGETIWMCPKCGTIHNQNTDTCQNESCSRKVNMIKMISFTEDEIKTCPSCGVINKDNSSIKQTMSSAVSDITILSQTMLSAMPEEKFQKILIFTDNRQDAAFQAAWMEERSKRFRLRHLLYKELDKQREKGFVHNFDSLVEDIKEMAYEEGIFKKYTFGKKDEEIGKRIRWFLLEEFCTGIHRKSSTENLGLSQIVYEGFDSDEIKKLTEKWAPIFNIQPEGVYNTIQLILDYIRRKNIVSDNLIRTQWYYTDKEVRDGIVSSQNIYPRVLSFEKPADEKLSKYFSVTYLASNQRSGVQVLLKKAIKKEEKMINSFLEELWQVLKNKGIFVDGYVIQSIYNKKKRIDIPGDSIQINIDKIGIIKPEKRYKCELCSKSHSKPLPTSLCAEYRCQGKTKEMGIEDDNYDVVQYTKMSFVPLKSHEHSAQVSKEERQKIEREFRKVSGDINCLVCTPTLELGVDLGKLEMALLRNTPPAPANYSQRAGRAGRRHRIAVIFTYCQKTSHDRYFFDKPHRMISGEIRLPAFSMNNELLVRKHAHSVILSTLRQNVNEKENEALNEIFPTFISEYIYTKDETGRVSYLNKPFQVEEKLQILIEKHKDEMKKQLKQTFKEQWPSETYEDTVWFSDDKIDKFMDEMPSQLQTHLNRLFKIINTYNREIKKYAEIEANSNQLDKEEEYERNKIKNALKSYTEKNYSTYSLGYLADDGFFPGYSLSRESSWAHCLDPYQEIIRPSSTALYEFAPGNYVYANKNQFRIHKLDFYKSKREEQKEEGYILGERLLYLREQEMVISQEQQTTEGGNLEVEELTSYELSDVELSHESRIDDSRDYRIRKKYQIILHAKPQHNGGFIAKINDKDLEFYHRRHVILINLGLTYKKDQRGFPICPRCGEIRSPDSTDVELQRFFEVHKKRCNIIEIKWATLHANMASDILFIGPYEREEDAVNAVEGIRIGTEQVLDTGEVELEVHLAKDTSGIFYATLLDPMPGGSGFLTKIVDEWPSIIKASIDKLENCRCEKACYSCMKRYRNQIFHTYLDRNSAKDLLFDLQGQVHKQTNVEPSVEKTYDLSTADSTAEERFIKILQDNSFPLPDGEHKLIVLSTGEKMQADFTYDAIDGKKIIIFIDGTSASLHGDPETARKDKILRFKAKQEGYLVLEITKQGLQDVTNVNQFLQELSIYLGKDDFIE